MQEYTVIEGGSGILEVCIIAIGELETNATITLSTSDASAIGKTIGLSYGSCMICPGTQWHSIPNIIFSSYYLGNSDYQPVTQALTFQQTQQLQCVNITILDDQILENAEYFFVNLTTDDLGIVFNTSSAVVTIGNDDGMHFLYWKYFLYCYNIIVNYHHS